MKTAATHLTHNTIAAPFADAFAASTCTDNVEIRYQILHGQKRLAPGQSHLEFQLSAQYIETAVSRKRSLSSPQILVVTTSQPALFDYLSELEDPTVRRCAMSAEEPKPG